MNLALIVVALGVLAYLAAFRRAGAAFSPCRRRRLLAAMVAAALLMTSFSPAFVAWAHHDFRGHMVQHLLVGMVAPLALVLAAPVSLALKVSPPVAGRLLVALLHSRWMRFVSHPVVALLLNIGGMYVLYLTPLYAAMLTTPWLHFVVHVHFLMAGYLFCWSILAGPDPTPRPPGLRLRVAVLFVFIAAHGVLGKLMYGYLWPRGTPHGAEQIREGAQIMYYGGDLAELLLAVTLFATGYGAHRFRAWWWPRATAD